MVSTNDALLSGALFINSDANFLGKTNKFTDKTRFKNGWHNGSWLADEMINDHGSTHHFSAFLVKLGH